MIWTLVGMAFAGMGCGGVAMLLRMLSRNRLPKWIIPVFAGLGMLAYQISIEYSALDLVEERLPEGTVVIATETDSMVWRPWTFIVPMQVSLTALDVANAETRFLEEGTRVVRFVLYRFEKQLVTQAIPQSYLLNCGNREVFEINDANQPLAAPLNSAARSERVLELLCQ